MSKKIDKLIIIDGNALVHRSFHALPPTMKTKNNEMVNAVYGFTSFLIKAIREIKPKYVVLTMDKKGPTFRHKKFKDYKAKRVKAPDELYAQIPIVKDVARSFNIPVFELAGFEADDLIGTITKKVNGEIEKIILTGDMDTLQLINEHTRVYTMSRGVTESVIYDEHQVKERYDIDVKQLIDYKALRGDPSDNIPGVAGIGEKTAVDLLKEFGDLDNLYKELEKNSQKVQENIKLRIQGLLKEYKEQAYLSQELATIKCDVDIDFDLEKALFKDLNKEKVVAKLSELEFKSLMPRAQALFSEQVTKSKEAKLSAAADKFERNKQEFKYRLVQKEKDFDKFLHELKKQRQFTFDTETSGFDPITSDLLGISFSWKKGEAYYLKVERKKSETKSRDLFNYQTENINQLTENKHPWLEKLKVVFEDEKIKKCAHNGKFDIRVMKNNGVEVRGFYFDTMLASYLLNPGTRQHNLDAATFSELGFEKISKDDLLGRGRDKVTFGEVDTEKLSLYSCEDADFTNRLVKKLHPALKEQGLDKLFKDIEIPLIKVLAQMEESGVKLNKKILASMSEKMNKKIKTLEKKIYKHAGLSFNINSPMQLKEVLFEKLEIPTMGIKKTKTGFSTAADELIKIKDLHPIVRFIQEYRELSKLTNTYIDALPNLINKKTKRIHTSYNQTITATGRLSSTEPNLQNIPIRTDVGREIRKAFVAEKGYKFLALDYSQIELRLAAHYSNDPKLIKAFKEKKDIHTSTAALINKINEDKVDKKIRREAKAINFGILYGQGPHGLSQTADIPYWQAKDFIDKYFEVYKGVKKYIDKQIKQAQEKGYVETLFGRKRYLPEINSSVALVRKAAERMAVNTPLQGSNADMIKIAMIKIYNLIQENYKQEEVRMILQVHDELIFEAKKDLVKELASQVEKIMKEVVSLKVPIVVDTQVGDNWGEMIKI